jgi:hypothetical protein
VVLAVVFLVQRVNYEVVGAAGFEWLLHQRQFGLSTLLAAAAALGLGALAASRRPPPAQGRQSSAQPPSPDVRSSPVPG